MHKDYQYRMPHYIRINIKKILQISGEARRLLTAMLAEDSFLLIFYPFIDFMIDMSSSTANMIF